MIWCVAACLAAGAIVRAADDSLRIVPIVSKDDVVVSFDGSASTRRCSPRLRADCERRSPTSRAADMSPPGRSDHRQLRRERQRSECDNLTRRHTLSRTIDGRVEQASVTEDETVVMRWLTSFNRLPLIPTSKLDQTRDYYVRVRARVRPRGTSLVGWTSGISGQAKFTFVP
jgi:hypothetical protein